MTVTMTQRLSRLARVEAIPLIWWWSVHEQPVSIQKVAVGGDIYVGCWSP